MDPGRFRPPEPADHTDDRSTSGLTCNDTYNDPIYVFDFGKPLMTGSPAEVRASELVRDAYLGKAAVA